MIQNVNTFLSFVYNQIFITFFQCRKILLKSKKSILNDAVLRSIKETHKAVVESCKKDRPARPRKRDIIPGKVVRPEDMEEEEEWVYKNCSRVYNKEEESRWVVWDGYDSKFHLECTHRKTIGRLTW